MIEKVYPRSKSYVWNTINDIAELQNAKLTFSDSPIGKIHFLVKMYGYKYEFKFSVSSIDENNTQVFLEVEQGRVGRNNMIDREIALLDSMLKVGEQGETYIK